jgi:hypothetical protein
MYKGLRRIVATVANEQMIEKSSLFRKEEQHQLLVRMNKK